MSDKPITMDEFKNTEIDFPSKQDLCDEIDRLVEQRDEERARAARLLEVLKFPFDIDCGSHSCRFAKKKTGMRTNGPCHCERFFETPVKVNDLLRHIYRQQQTLIAHEAAERKGEG